MGNGYGVVQTDETVLRDTILEIFRRLRELEALDGTQIYDTVQQLKKLIEGALNPTSVTTPGDITSTGGNVRADAGTFISAYARSHSVVTSYVAAYIDGSGNFLATPSSARMKRDVKTRSWTAEQRARIRIVEYKLRAAYILATMRDQDPETVDLLIGVIGEELLAAGFDEFVVLDERGRVFTVRYELLGLIALDAAQQHDAELEALRDDVAELRELVAARGIS